jgi:hypothetical protein
MKYLFSFLLTLLVGTLGMAGCVWGQDDFDKTIWPRDIFSVMMRGQKPPIRGWNLSFKRTGIEFDGSIDYDEYIITATKKGEPTKYFHVSEKQGVENDTDQSVYEVRVKEVKDPSEDWMHNAYWDEGVWSGERGKSAHWVPNKSGNTGVCSHDSNWLGSAELSTTKEECFQEGK